MSLTAKLALQQLKIAKKRTIWTTFGISLSVAMLTAVNGLVTSFMAAMGGYGRTIHWSERIGFLIIALILGGIIAIASIIVISNAFRVSAAERTRQFGLLKSTGATKKQIGATVMHEALFLSIIGLPVGLLAGLLTQLIATALANHTLQPIRRFFDYGSERMIFPFVIAPTALGLAVIASFIVIILSAWLPARKAAKISAISAIMHSHDVKMKKARRFGIARFIFGFEGQLAAGQLRRSRSSFRASVISLTISIVLVLAGFSARTHFLRQADIMYENVNANVRASLFVHQDWMPPCEDSGMLYPQEGGLPAIGTQHIKQITELLSDYPYADVRGFGYVNYRIDIRNSDTPGLQAGFREMPHYDGGYPISMMLMVLEPELYAAVTSDAGVPLGSNVIINVQRTSVGDVIWETHPYDFMVGEYLNIFQSEWRPNTHDEWHEWEVYSTHRDIFIHGQVTSLPDVMLDWALNRPTIIVPDLDVREFEWFILVDDPQAYINDHARDALSEIQQTFREEYGLFFSAFARDITFQALEIEVLVNLITVFVGGFVGMLTLIGITNVISTISTNTRLRVKEFAILASVGMTRGGIGKMLALESLLCSARSLMFGLPLGVLAAWGIYVGTQMDRVRFSFIFPWEAFIACIVGVFVLTFAATMFSASRFRNENIIEAIRG